MSGTRVALSREPDTRLLKTDTALPAVALGLPFSGLPPLSSGRAGVPGSLPAVPDCVVGSRALLHTWAQARHACSGKGGVCDYSSDLKCVQRGQSDSAFIAVFDI